jgi:hypothetical protein
MIVFLMSNDLFCVIEVENIEVLVYVKALLRLPLLGWIGFLSRALASLNIGLSHFVGQLEIISSAFW